jgi:hypothetical protein
VNTKYAAMGALESGAAMKAIDEYSQNFASNELANYMDQLYRQEALGASAASSLAGVGTNLVSQVSANNNNAAMRRAMRRSSLGRAARIRGTHRRRYRHGSGRNRRRIPVELHPSAGPSRQRL